MDINKIDQLCSVLENRNKCPSLIRAKGAISRLAISKSKFYELLKNNFLPQGVKRLDDKIVFWAEYEIDIIARAYMLGFSAQEMKILSQRIEKARNII